MPMLLQLLGLATPGSLSIPQLRSYSTKYVWQQYQLMDPVILTEFDLAGANPTLLNPRYSNLVRCTIKICLRTGIPSMARSVGV
jgi:hypothetical protein